MDNNGTKLTNQERATRKAVVLQDFNHGVRLLTYPKSNQTTQQGKEPKSMGKSGDQTENRDDETRDIHGFLPAKLVTERTDCYSTNEKANKNHRGPDGAI